MKWFFDLLVSPMQLFLIELYHVCMTFVYIYADIQLHVHVHTLYMPYIIIHFFTNRLIILGRKNLRYTYMLRGFFWGGYACFVCWRLLCLFENQFIFFFHLILCYSPFDHIQVQYIICICPLLRFWFKLDYR